MRFRDGYDGSSFMELLETEYPYLAPRWDRLFAAVGELPAQAHGTTVIGLRFADGALTVTRAQEDKPRAAVSGTMDSLMGVSLGQGMVGPWLAGKLKTRGNLLFLLKMLPLMTAD